MSRLAFATLRLSLSLSSCASSPHLLVVSGSAAKAPWATWASLPSHFSSGSRGPLCRMAWATCPA
eukprot:11067577-Heterocapsa_arctica.AAC.1